MEDRTDEFLNLARSLPVTAQKQPDTTTDDKKKSYAELRNFHKTAGDISRDIASTSALLSELTKLVRHQSPLDDDSDKINNLVVRIKSSIENLNSRLDHAGHSIAQQKRKLGQQAGQEAANLVDGLKSEFAEAATGFKQVLQQRTNTMKENDDMKQQVYGTSDDDDIPNLNLNPPPVFGTHSQGSMGSFPTLDLTSGMMETGQTTSSSLPRPHGLSSSDYNVNGIRNRRTHESIPSYSGSYSTYDESKPLTPLDIQRMDEEAGAGQMMQLIPDQDYLQQRADAMSTVESNIVELGTIFNKLAGLVSEHREMVQRVEDNVEDANANINLSLNTLTDTLTSLQTNRALALRVFSVLVLFIIMFIIFVA